MKIAAIICEYNPFHNGHKFHIDETRRQTGADAVVALMSGNYVQRGECAIYEKTVRANAAVLGGADLVLELPTVFAVQSAEFFAKNSVKILDALGCADTLAFGAECSDTEEIKKIAEFLSDEPPEYRARLAEVQSLGKSYPAARAECVREFLGDNAAEILSAPNNILAVEYCKALFSIGSTIVPHAICRRGAEHDSAQANAEFASASYIRSLLQSGKTDKAFEYIPPECREIFISESIHSAENMSRAIIGEILKMPTDELALISDVSEGLENRIKEKTAAVQSLAELADAVKTKRYTHSRVRRILLHAYLGIKPVDRTASPPYIKVLAHNTRGCEVIRLAKKTAKLPIVRNTSQINKLRDKNAKLFWERERVFDRLYALFRQ